MKTLSEKLAENLKYYTDNPKKRCKKNGKCKYSGQSLRIKTKGCFVGKLMNPKDRKEADERNINDVYHLIFIAPEFGIKLPEIIKCNGRIMSHFQELHDDDDSWNNKGLSISGKARLKHIIKANNLDIKPFNQFFK